MICYRTYRNNDPPVLAGLWNRGVPGLAVARPLTSHEFDALVLDKPTFDPLGLIIAEDDGRAVGFVHAGFGLADEGRIPRAVDTEIGTIAMCVVEPDRSGDFELSHGLIQAGESYLRALGAKVIYAGCQHPLDPFYWGVYGGSECSGILSTHVSFHQAALHEGYEPVSHSVLLETDLKSPEPRDPKAVILRRQTRVEIIDDVAPTDWWESAAIGLFRPTLYRLISKADEREIGSARTWEMAGFGRVDGRVHLGLHAVEIAPDLRRQGYGRYLVGEIIRKARSQWNERIDVQTRSTNLPALALYESLGFVRIETATLYRKPG